MGEFRAIEPTMKPSSWVSMMDSKLAVLVTLDFSMFSRFSILSLSAWFLSSRFLTLTFSSFSRVSKAHSLLVPVELKCDSARGSAGEFGL